MGLERVGSRVGPGCRGRVAIVGAVSQWSKSQNVIPNSALESFDVCDEDFFPNIKILLKVLMTLPISTATAERTFSTLRRVKSYKRATMGNQRLNGLILLTIYRANQQIC